MDTSPNDRDESNRQAIVRANNRGVLVRKAMEEDEGGSRSREQIAELLGIASQEVFQRTPIPAMARARDGLATRTGSRVLTVSFHDPTLVRLEHAAKRHVAQIGEEICVR